MARSHILFHQRLRLGPALPNWVTGVPTCHLNKPPLYLDSHNGLCGLVDLKTTLVRITDDIGQVLMRIHILNTFGIIRVGVVCLIICGDFSSCVTLYVCFLAISLPFSASRYFAVTEDSVLAAFVLTANELGIIVARHRQRQSR